MSKLSTVIETLEASKLEHIVVYDMRTYSPFFDYVIVTTADNPRKLRGAINRMKKAFDEAGFDTFNVEGAEGAKWVLLDGGDVVVNLFTEEERAYYNLEKIWHDVPTLDVNALK